MMTEQSIAFWRVICSHIRGKSVRWDTSSFRPVYVRYSTAQVATNNEHGSPQPSKLALNNWHSHSMEYIIPCRLSTRHHCAFLFYSSCNSIVLLHTLIPKHGRLSDTTNCFSNVSLMLCCRIWIHEAEAKVGIVQINILNSNLQTGITVIDRNFLIIFKGEEK